MTLDRYDKKLLTLLQENNRLSQRDLAEAVNLSASAVNRRIAALEAAGVITQNVSIVDPSKCGRPLTVLAKVRLENERLDLLTAHKQAFNACPQVQQAYYVTGDHDFVLILNVKDMAEYEALTQTLFFASGNVKSFETIVAMSNTKQSLKVLID